MNYGMRFQSNLDGHTLNKLIYGTSIQQTEKGGEIH